MHRYVYLRTQPPRPIAMPARQRTYLVFHDSRQQRPIPEIHPEFLRIYRARTQALRGRINVWSATPSPLWLPEPPVRYHSRHPSRHGRSNNGGGSPRAPRPRSVPNEAAVLTCDAGRVAPSNNVVSTINADSTIEVVQGWGKFLITIRDALSRLQAHSCIGKDLSARTRRLPKPLAERRRNGFRIRHTSVHSDQIWTKKRRNYAMSLTTRCTVMVRFRRMLESIFPKI